MEDYEEIRWLVDNLSTILYTQKLQQWNEVESAIRAIKADPRIPKDDFRVRVALENLAFVKAELKIIKNKNQDARPFWELIYQSHQMLSHYFNGMEAEQFHSQDKKKTNKRRKAA